MNRLPFFSLLRLGNKGRAEFQEAFIRHTRRANEVQTLLRVYYLVLFGVCSSLALPRSLNSSLFPHFRWPLQVFSGMDLNQMLLGCSIALLFSCVFAALRPTSQSSRIAVFLALLSLNAAFNSKGAQTHLFLFWLWSSAILALIPSQRFRWIGQSKRRRHHRLVVGWWAAQAIVLLFYGLSGFWKAFGAFHQIARDEVNLFAPQGLSYHLASEMIRAGANPVLGNWLMSHEALQPLLGIGVTALQLACLVGIFNCGLRRPLGVSLLAFHFFTYLFLSISYPTNVFLVGVLFLSESHSRTSWFKSRRVPTKRFGLGSVYGTFLVSYLALALGTAVFSREREVFPLFNGSWFTEVPSRITDYGLFVTALDGQVLDPPKYVESLDGRFPAWRFAIYGAIQAWGSSFEREGPEKIKHREFALKLIFRSRPYKAELRRRTLDPLEFVKNDQVISERTLTREATGEHENAL